MEPYLTVSIVLGAVICALHIASAVLGIFRPLIAKILGYVNLALHIPFLLMIMLADAEYEIAALAIVGTLLVYTVAHFVAGRVVLSREKRENEEAVGDDV